MLQFITVDIKNEQERIIPLWQEAFGDTKAEIVFFLNNVKGCKCLAASENGKLLSMLFLVECSLKGKKAEYVYAACTLKESRNKGLMYRLLEYCKSSVSCPVCLIPASDALVAYYAKSGFKQKAEINDLGFNQTEEIREYLLEGYSLSKPKVYYTKGE